MSSDRYAYVDALRGFAILAVVSSHSATLANVRSSLDPFVDLGGMGVQLFFVVSAFTIFLTYERAVAREAQPVQNFFIRRVLRIVPIYWLGIILYSAVYGLGSRGWGADPELWHFPLHLTLVNVLHPLTSSSVVPGGWSISTEILFYLTVPLWFVLIRRLRSALIFTVVSIFAGGATVWLGQMLLNPILPGDPSQYWFRSFPFQLPCFGFGMVLYFAIKEDTFGQYLRTRSVNLGVLACSPIVILLGVWERSPLIPSLYVITFGFLLTALALSHMPWRLFVNRATILVGRVSYSIYLIHFLVLAQLEPFVPATFSPGVRFLCFFVLGTLISLPIAYLSYHYVEKAFTNLGRHWIARREGRGAIDPNKTAAASTT